MPRGEQPDYSMDLGEVKGGIKALQGSMERVLDWQEGFPQRMEEDRRRIYERIEKRDLKYNETLSDIQHSLEQANVRLENFSEAMEGHGAALVNMENRISDLEIKDRIRVERRRWMKRWVARAAAFLATVFGGDQVLGGKLLKALGVWMKSKPPGS